MAINSTHHNDSSAISQEQEPRLIDLRFSLRRLMANTALADIFWANDLHGTTDNMPEKNVLMLLVNPALTSLPSFATAWQQVLGRPAPPATAYPDVIAYGEHEGAYWLALNNVSGILLSERISELDERGIPLNTALDTLQNIHQTLDSVQAGAYGYIEPGVLQYTERGSYKILNAPLVKVMQLLTSARKGTINQLALHSAYLSPSVSVGDVPVTEDDTFSTASLLYTMLSGKPPFGAQSTLTAVAHGDKPLPLKQLKKQSWEAVEQALTYQRSARPENPEKFLAQLKKSKRTKVLFPLAALAALGVTVFAGQHLVGRLGEYMPADGLLSDKQQANNNSGLLSNQTDNVTVPSTQPNQASASKVQSASQADTQDQISTNNTNGTTTSEITLPARTDSNNSTANNRAANNRTNRQTTNTETAAAQNNQQAAEPEQSATNTNSAGNATQNVNRQATQATQATEANKTARSNNNDTDNRTVPTRQANTSSQADSSLPNTDTVASSNLLNNTDRTNTDRTTDQPIAAAETGITPNNDTAGADTRPANATLNNENTTMATTATPAANTNNTQQGGDSQQQQNKQQLLQQALAAFNAGQLEDSDSGKQGSISLLRELVQMDDENPEATALMGKVVEKKYQLAERRLGAKKFGEAEALVQDSDQLIREFMLTDKLQRQVRMESKVSILRGEQQQVDDLLRDARTAINLGTLSQSDGQDHALSYLRRVMFKQPGNTEAGKLLAEIASRRQQAVYRALDRGEMTRARTYLRESERLVKKYRLKDLRADQEAVGARYEALLRQNTNSTGVVDQTPQQTNQRQAETDAAQQRQLQQQANAEAEAARQRQLQQQAAAEIARQRQLQQQANAQAEAARQRQLQQQAQQAQTATRQRQLQQQAQQQAQAEAARQRQLQQQLQQQQAAARQRQLQQQQAATRQWQLQQQQIAARQRQLQQQQAQQIDGFIVDENGFVIGEPPLVDELIAGTLDGNDFNGEGAAVIAIPVQRLQPNSISMQEIEPNGATGNPQAVPVWEGNNLQAQFDNFQTQANAVNAPFPGEEEVVPELQEMPLSLIEEILPGSGQQ